MTDRYAVIGHPIGHSKSPQIHGAFAKALGHDIEYTRIEAPLDGFAATVHDFQARGGMGINVTTPFKLDAFALADEALDRARRAGASNCLKFEPDGRVLAENFDGVGLARDIEHNLHLPMQGRRVLILGAGGATRGLLAPFLASRPDVLLVANRTATKADELANDFAALGPVHGCGLSDLSGERFDIVVNATSTGLHGEAPAVDKSVFAGASLAYELSYGRGLTPFLRLARDAGAATLADGVGMLVEQAAEAFFWWRGVRPDTQPVIALLSVPLA